MWAKPSPEGMVRALRAMEKSAGGHLDHVLVVADMPSDAQAAEALRTETSAEVWMVKPTESGWHWPVELQGSGVPEPVLGRLGLQTG